MLMNQSLRRPNIYGPIPFSSHIGTLLFKPRFPYREPDIPLNAAQSPQKESSVPTTPTKSPPPKVAVKPSAKPANGSVTTTVPAAIESKTSPTGKVTSPTRTPVNSPVKAANVPSKAPVSPTSKAPVNSSSKAPVSPTSKAPISPTSNTSPALKSAISSAAKASAYPSSKAPISPPAKAAVVPPAKTITSTSSRSTISPPPKSTVIQPAKSNITHATGAIGSTKSTVSPPSKVSTHSPAKPQISPPIKVSASPQPKAPVSPASKSLVNPPVTKSWSSVSPPRPMTESVSKPLDATTAIQGTTPVISSNSPAPNSSTMVPIPNGIPPAAYVSPAAVPIQDNPYPAYVPSAYKPMPPPTTIEKNFLPSVQPPKFVEDKKVVQDLPKFEPTFTHNVHNNYNYDHSRDIQNHHDHRNIQNRLCHNGNYDRNHIDSQDHNHNRYYNGHEDHKQNGHDHNHNGHEHSHHEDENSNLFSYQIEDSSLLAHQHDAPKAHTSISAKNFSHSGQSINSNDQNNKQNYIPTRIMVQEIDEGQPCLTCKGTCPGFRSHCWRKICTHCKCTRESHDVYQRGSSNVLDRIGLKAQSIGAMHMSKEMSIGSGFSWVPAGLPVNKIEEYMSQLPNHKVPRNHTTGEKYRNKQLVVQLPRQDLAAAYCKHLSTAAEQRSYEDFVNTRNEMALDIGYVNSVLEKSMECRKCKGVLDRNELAVMAPKFGLNVCWHPACFVCSSCDELLVDLTYCIRDGKIYCERHYAELNKPRCAACDELIFAGEYTKAMNQDWHSGHFCCWQCDQTLTGQRYILRDDHPYCIKCYEEVFANSCDECAKPIGIDSKDLSYKEKHWHENCFLCSMCKISLVDKPFGSKNDRIFCASCYDQAFATRCDGCGEIFKAGMKKMEYKGKQWHDKCFCCALCKAPIGTKSFIPKNEEVYCATCYEEKFATRCTKCKKVISSGGVTYKNEPWHKECFCCCNCGSSLAGQRFTSKDEKPYCANCFGELFAKRCTACTQPITGIGGSKFISFEDRHWHNDCFICAQCQTSLVGKGFITDAADILCPECAKARLMAQHA